MFMHFQLECCSHFVLPKKLALVLIELCVWLQTVGGQEGVAHEQEVQNRSRERLNTSIVIGVSAELHESFLTYDFWAWDIGCTNSPVWYF